MPFWQERKSSNALMTAAKMLIRFYFQNGVSHIIVLLFVVVTYSEDLVQDKFSDDPDSARFVTDDIDHFLRAFEDYKYEPNPDDQSLGFRY
jgi:hypothetical protein